MNMLILIYIRSFCSVLRSKGIRHSERRRLPAERIYIYITRNITTISRCVIKPYVQIPFHRGPFPSNWWSLCEFLQAVAATAAAWTRNLRSGDTNGCVPAGMGAFWTGFEILLGNGESGSRAASSEPPNTSYIHHPVTGCTVSGPALSPSSGLIVVRL